MVGPLGDAAGQPYFLALLFPRLQVGWKMPSDPNWSKPTPLPSALGIAPSTRLAPATHCQTFLGGRAASPSVGTCQSFPAKALWVLLLTLQCKPHPLTLQCKPRPLYNAGHARCTMQATPTLHCKPGLLLTLDLSGPLRLQWLSHCHILSPYPPCPLYLPSPFRAELYLLALTSDSCSPAEWVEDLRWGTHSIRVKHRFWEAGRLV